MRTSTQQLVITLMATFLLIVVLAATMETNTSVNMVQAVELEDGAALPAEIITEAVRAGGVQVALMGTFEEKHNFAKGIPTQYGKMAFNADDFLKYRAGWSEQKIHSVGYALGFSNLWKN